MSVVGILRSLPDALNSTRSSLNTLESQTLRVPLIAMRRLQASQQDQLEPFRAISLGIGRGEMTRSAKSSLGRQNTLSMLKTTTKDAFATGSEMELTAAHKLEFNQTLHFK